jgi:hypothetical protein
MPPARPARPEAWTEAIMTTKKVDPGTPKIVIGTKGPYNPSKPPGSPKK